MRKRISVKMHLPTELYKGSGFYDTLNRWIGQATRKARCLTIRSSQYKTLWHKRSDRSFSKVFWHLSSVYHLTPIKSRLLKKWRQQKSIKDNRRFIGMCSYYRSCLPSFAAVSEPLVALTRKHDRFEWTEKCQKAFKKLKRLFVYSHVMAPSNANVPYRLYNGACHYAVGAILVQ